MAESNGGDALVMGGTSALGTWLADLLREACARASPPIELRAAGRNHHVDDLGRHGAARILLVAVPTQEIMDFIADGTGPIVAVLDDPVDCVRLSMVANGGDLLAALREQTASAAAHHLLVDNPRVLIVRRGAGRRARELVADALRHLRLELDPAARDAVLQATGDPTGKDLPLERVLARHVPHHVPLDRLGDAVPVEVADVVRQVLSPVVFGALSRDIGYVTWPARVFYCSDMPDREAPRIINLTGTARNIYYGPYFHLPPGTWQVQIRIAFSREVRNVRFKLYMICGPRVVTTVEFRPTREGAFSGTFQMTHTAPHDFIEINFRNEEGMIDGSIALGQLTFVRLAA